MKVLKKLAITLAIPCVLLGSASLQAQTGGPAKPTVEGAVNLELSSGEVKKVDRDAQKITIKHGEIKNLEMPPMTMVFKVQEPAFLDKVKPGDKVNFRVEKREGAIVLIAVDVIK
jgi:Cu(I)/Ag(I) efflux system protein CusF